MKRQVFFIFFVLFSLSSCELFYPPFFYNSMASKKETNGSGFDNGGGNKTNSITSENTVYTLYVSGNDHNNAASVWSINTGNTNNIIKYVLDIAGSTANYLALKGDLLYVGGGDSATFPEGVFWVINTNSGVVSTNIVYTPATQDARIIWIGFDPDGNLAYVGYKEAVTPFCFTNNYTFNTTGSWYDEPHNPVFYGGNFYVLTPKEEFTGTAAIILSATLPAAV